MYFLDYCNISTLNEIRSAFYSRSLFTMPYTYIKEYFDIVLPESKEGCTPLCYPTNYKEYIDIYNTLEVLDLLTHLSDAFEFQAVYEDKNETAYFVLAEENDEFYCIAKSKEVFHFYFCITSKEFLGNTYESILYYSIDEFREYYGLE